MVRRDGSRQVVAVEAGLGEIWRGAISSGKAVLVSSGALRLGGAGSGTVGQGGHGMVRFGRVWQGGSGSVG